MPRSDEARAAGAFSAGYLPEGLPPSAHDIREAHDPGLRRPLGHFQLSAGGTRSARWRSSIPRSSRWADSAATCRGRIEWWPPLLRDALDAERIKATGLQTYRSRSGDRLYAVNWSQGRAYIWTRHTP